MAEVTRAVLLQKILDAITTNNNREITGAQLNEILGDFVDSIPFRLSDAGLGNHINTVNYQLGQAVIVGGEIFTSDLPNNIGAFNPANWTNLSGGVGVANVDLNLYDNATNYAINDFVESGLAAFISLQNGNQGNDPAASPAFWQQIIANNGAFGNVYVVGLYSQTDVVRHDNRLWELVTATPVGAPFNSADIDVEIAAGDWKQLLDEAGDAESFQDSVISILVDPSSVVPVKEDRFLIADSAIGIWAGRDGQIADFRGANYRYIAPEDGFVIKVNTDDNVLYQQEGDYVAGVFAWLAFPAGGTAAAGNPTEIQFNTAGVLDADANFNYDKANGRLGINVVPLVGLHLKNAVDNSQIWNIASPTADKVSAFLSGEGTAEGSYSKWVRFSNNTATVKAKSGSLSGLMFITNNQKNILISGKRNGVSDFFPTLYIDGTNDRAGFGTTAPAAQVHVKGPGSTSATFAQQIDNAAGSVTAVFRDDGRLGIGLTNPGSRLTVKAATTGDGIRLNNTSGAFAGGMFYSTTLGAQLVLSNVNASADVFNINRTTNDYVNTGKKFGIGTTTPDSKLTVEAQVTGDGIRLNNTVSAFAGGMFYSTVLGGQLVLSNVNASADVLNINRTTHDYLKTGKNFGLGLTNPNEKFEVVGNVRVSGNYKVGANQIIGARKGGWAVPTGTTTRTDFDPATIVLAALAEQVNALKTDFHATAGHGAIGV